LTKAAKAIIAEDSGASLHQCVVELEAENSQLKATAAESAGMISTLQCAVDIGVKDYALLMEGYKSLLAQRDDFHHHCEGLEVEVAEVGFDAKKKVADLEGRVKCAKAHSVDIAATGQERLRDFEDGLIRDLVELHALYECNTQTIGGLCSPMLEGEPSTADYLHWLSTEISGLLDMFGGVNENFITAAVEGALILASSSVDLDALQDAAAASGVDILPMEHDVCRAACAVSKKWWRSFGYNYVLDAIRARLHEVVTDV
jgi:hypothetical protein